MFRGSQGLQRFAIVVAIVMACITTPAHADSRPVDCELTVQGRTYIKGVCQFSSTADGSFQIVGKDYFAYVNVLSPGVAEASWNADPASTHAHARLGEVRQGGGCWTGKDVKICARALSPAAEKAVIASQPNGLALFPEVALQSCIGVEGSLEPGASLVLHSCQIPSDLIFVRRQDGSLGVAKQPELCVGLQAPGMSQPPKVVLEKCQAGSPRWTTAATGTVAAPVKTTSGLCLSIPQMDVPDARFPFSVQAAPCTDERRAIRFILSKG